ncbi:MAG: DNA polymerase III subunit delta' [Microcoleaceae cyanobacterium]
MKEFFSPLIEQHQAVELLTQTVKQNRIAPAYLFVGSEGIGRSLAARCFVELLFYHSEKTDQTSISRRIQQRNHPDFLWVEPTYLHQGQLLTVEAAKTAGIKRKSPPQVRLDQIRELSRFLSRPPLEAHQLVVVIEQAETMAEAAANGLLKTLEEPGNATIILIAPSVDSLLPTLISRCAKIPFYRLSQTAIEQVLQQQNYEEILAHPEVIEMAQGSPGKAIHYWQQFQTIPTELLTKLQQPPQNLRVALELAKEISKTLDIETQLWLVDYLQHCYWQSQPTKADSYNILKQLEKTRQYLLSYAQPRLVWETTFLSLCTS